MPYVVDFCIASLVYLGIITAFYLSQSKVSSLQNRLYLVLLILGLSSLALDILAAYVDGNSVIPVPLSYFLNIIFLLIAQLNGPIFLCYVLVLIGKYPKINKPIKRLIFLPLLVILGFLILSCFTKYGIFYLDTANNYYHGRTHFILYVVISIYFLVSALAITLSLRRTNKKKAVAVYSFIGVTLVTMVLQVALKNYLLNSMGNALALMIMYYTLQGPDNLIDPLTKLLNKSSLSKILVELSEQNISYRVYVFLIADFQKINQTYGIKAGDEVLLQFSKYLAKAYRGNYIIRLVGDAYLVIDIKNHRKLTVDELFSIKQKAPHLFNINLEKIKVDYNVLGINSNEYSSYKDIDSLIEYIRTKHEAKEDEACIIADQAYYKECQQHSEIEIILNDAIINKTIEVYYQPIHDTNNKFVALEALCRLYDPKLGFIRPDIFIDIAEKNGSIFTLGELIIEKVCQFIMMYHVKTWNLHHIGVNLSFLQCTKNNLYERINKIISRYDIPHNLIAFEITETATSSSLSIVKENMLKLTQDNYRFLLDDFGNGYANYNYILELPFFCIKFDRSILWHAMKNEQDMTYLKALVTSLNKLNLITVSEGVETEEQALVLKEINVSMLQGYLFNRALPPNEIYEYYQNSRKIEGGNQDVL